MIPFLLVILTASVALRLRTYNLFHSISTSLVLHGKNKEIKVYKDEVLELTKRVHQLELENEKQKNNPEEPEDPKSL